MNTSVLGALRRLVEALWSVAFGPRCAVCNARNCIAERLITETFRPPLADEIEVEEEERGC